MVPPELTTAIALAVVLQTPAGSLKVTEGAVVYPEPPLDRVTPPTTLSDILVDAAAPTPPSSPVGKMTIPGLSV